jgi:hypothetical protein
MMGSIVAVVRWYRPDKRFDVNQLTAAHTALYLTGLCDSKHRGK